MNTTELASSISADQRAAFARDGVIVIRNLLSPDEVARFRAALLARSAPDRAAYCRHDVFTQVVDTWRDDPVLRELALHSKLIAVARGLCDGAVRLWHDQILTKAPGNGAPTHYHQDQPYWPVPPTARSFAFWLALGDTPEAHGCMSFLPGSQRLRELPAQDLNDAGSLLGLCPDLAYAEARTIPLRAGDVTVHDGMTAHRAGANQLDRPRVAHSVIYLEADVCYRAQAHVVTDPLGLTPGQPLPDDRFPRFE
ncbi:MAG: phytanoyl-CoA dioxygenase family protein [Planctomycetota bacterium]|jgi:phytanoyl-CoA hydroxylase|nr:phytanoyl-CoA dioxygenase family protein [Planctomycetota bacterium]